MVRSASQERSAGGAVKAAVAVVFVIAMALVVLLLVRASPATEPFDPRSGRPDGARGLVLTLQSAGAVVVDTRDAPGTRRVDSERILVLEDRLDDEQRNAVLDFAEAGGVVVVADPESTLHGGPDVDGGAVQVSTSSPEQRRSVELETSVLPGRCTIASLTELRGVFVPDGVLFPVGPSEPQCFTEPRSADRAANHSFVIVREFGDGLIVGLGDNDAFTNAALRRSDNAGLIVSLLVPTPDTDVTFLVGRGASPMVRDVGSGDETLRDLVPPWAWMSLVAGAVAFVVFAVSRGVREGRIVTEPVATQVAGSELVSATGNLMQRAGHSAHAGRLLITRLHRDLAQAHGIDVNAPLGDLDRAVSLRSGTAPGEIEYLLERTVTDNRSLVELTAAIDSIRQQVLAEPIPVSTDERVTTS